MEDYREGPQVGYVPNTSPSFCHVIFKFFSDSEIYDFVLFERGHLRKLKYDRPILLYYALARNAVDVARQSGRLVSENADQLRRLLQNNMTVEMHYTTLFTGDDRDRIFGPGDVFTNGNTNPDLVQYLTDFATENGGQRVITCRLPGHLRDEFRRLLRR